MGAAYSSELGDASLSERLRESLDVAAHRLNADDPQLVELHVPNHGLGDVGLIQGSSAVAASTHLQSLDLGYNGIGPAGIQHLATALRNSQAGNSLVELRLSGNPIGKEGIDALCEWLDATVETGSLRSLYLFQCDLDDQCLLRLANTLQRQRTITALNLDMNKFTKKTPLILAQMLRHNESLAQLSFESPYNAGAFSEAAMTEIHDSLERNAAGLAHREHMEQVKALKAQRRREKEEAEKRARDAALAEERKRVEEELSALEELKRKEDDEVRALEARMAETVAKRNAKATASQAARQNALEKAIGGAYEWRDKLTAGGTLQKEWRSGFTVMKTAPGVVGGTPTLSSEPPRRLKACWCDPQDATAPYAKRLHYHCKWEDLNSKAETETKATSYPSAKGKSKGSAVPTGDGEGPYCACRGTGHICSSVGFYTKARPDLSAPHFFASPHPGAAPTQVDE